MKKTFFLSMLISLAVICSCQKQDSAAQAQLAQRKTELDAREEALIQREKAVDEREKAVADREKAVATSRTIQSQRQRPDAAQAEAERQRRIQQLPPELRALVARTPPDASREKAERDRAAQQRAVQTQPSVDDARRKKMFGAMAAPQPQGPDAAIASPVPSPTPE